MKRVTVEFVFDLCGSCPHYALDEQFCFIIHRGLDPYIKPPVDCPMEDFKPDPKEPPHDRA